MKKALMFFGIAVLFFLSLAFFDFAFNNFVFPAQAHKAIRENYTEKYNWLYADETLTDDKQKIVVDFVDALPDDIKATLKNDWIIVCTYTIPDNLKTFSKKQLEACGVSGRIIGGITYFRHKVIYLRTIMDDKAFDMVVAHEAGHFASYLCGNACDSNEWETIYEKNKNTFNTDSYFLTTPSEFFACCYEEYFNNTEHLKENSIDAYNYMFDFIAA